MIVRVPKEIAAAAKFCSTEPVRYSLMGVRVEGKHGIARITASDGKRIVDIKLKEEDDPVMDGLVIVPHKPFAEAAKNCGRPGQYRDVDGRQMGLDWFEIEPVDGDTVRLRARNAYWERRTIEVQPIDGAYPDPDYPFPAEPPSGAAAIVVNPRILGEALLALDAMKIDKHAQVTVGLYSDQKDGPRILLKMKTDHAEIRAMVMGLSCKPIL